MKGWCLMLRALLVVVGLFAILGGHVSAVSCVPNPDAPVGAVLTPECTWIIAQYDPGVWIDQLKQLWILRDGLPVKATLEELRIGVR